MDLNGRADNSRWLAFIAFAAVLLWWVGQIHQRVDQIAQNQEVVMEMSRVQNNILREHQKLMTKEVMSWNNDAPVINPRTSLSVQKKEIENDR